MSDEPEMRVRWASRVDFHEYAEALSVNTNQIMAVGMDGLVLFTPNEADIEDVWSARVTRDAIGLLVVRECVHRPGLWTVIMELADNQDPEFWAKAKRAIEVIPDDEDK